MAEIAYTVTATFPDPEVRHAYVRWLREGHVAAVLRGGATGAWIVGIDEPQEPLSVQTRYLFPSREAFERYVTDHAPALRQDGLIRFGSQTGVEFSREVGTVIEASGTNG